MDWIWDDLIFARNGIMPRGSQGKPAISRTGFEWNYTTWLNIVAIFWGAWLAWLHFTGMSSG